MSNAARHYAQTATAAMSPRELEASALLKAAARLQAAADGDGPATIQDALDHNRRLWTVFAGSVSDPASKLPEDVRARILALADFVFNRTLLAQGKAEAADLSVLVRINRELASGLRANS